MVKNPPADARDGRDAGLILVWEDTPGRGQGNPLQYSCLENPMDRGAWWATVHSVTKSQAQLKWLSMHTWPYQLGMSRNSLEVLYSLKDWCWSWNSNTLATWCEELTPWKRPCCWEGLKAGGEGDDRKLDGWMASPTQWTWVWASSGSWWWKGSLACCNPWGHKELDTTKLQN